MPTIEVKTNVKVNKIEAFLKAITEASTTILSKPKEYIQVILNDEVPMIFAGTTDPTYMVRIHSRGGFSDSSNNQRMSKEFADVFKDLLGVESTRGYFYFKDPGEHKCGWNNTTFP
ncbi:19325_t:CDS:2 [Cetraspora pellucida]|uniref:L-dopachrome isomerase n=1 Tax=Cetraspora pellucida TaxID=1433469 RepID=A0A9N9K035_9GLOM|nr:19325_t:CDS:2 [Cetraspora pellucida]